MNISKETRECSICLIDYNTVDKIILIKSCKHMYHKKCILEWNKRNNTCPLCRTIIVIEGEMNGCKKFFKKLFKYDKPHS
jgi:hypothetical protein